MRVWYSTFSYGRGVVGITCHDNAGERASRRGVSLPEPRRFRGGTRHSSCQLERDFRHSASIRAGAGPQPGPGLLCRATGLGGSRAALGADPVPQDNSYCSAAVNLCAIAPEGLIRDVYSKKNYATNEEIPALQIIFLHANMLARYGGVTRSVIVATLREAHHIL